MPTKEINEIVKAVACSRASDVATQREILQQLTALRGQLGDHLGKEVESCLEIAEELSSFLADGRPPTPEELLTVIAKLVVGVECSIHGELAGATTEQALPEPPPAIPRSSETVLHLSDSEALPPEPALPWDKPTAQPPELVLSLGNSNAPDDSESVTEGEHKINREDVHSLSLSRCERGLGKHAVMNDMALGEILVQLGMVTSTQVEQALDVQRTGGRRLGDALIHLGFIQLSDLQDAINLQGKLRDYAAKAPEAPDQGPSPVVISDWHTSLLGEVLVSTNVITRGELDQARSDQRATGLRIGETLVQNGTCDWTAIRCAIRLQEKIRNEKKVTTLSIGEGGVIRHAS